MPVVRALLVSAARIGGAVIAQTFLVFVAHERHLVAGGIEVVVNTLIHARLTEPHEVGQTAILPNTAYIGSGSHDVIQCRAGILSWSWGNTGCRIVFGIAWTHVQIHFANSLVAGRAFGADYLRAFVNAAAIGAKFISLALAVFPAEVINHTVSVNADSVSRTSDLAAERYTLPGLASVATGAPDEGALVCASVHVAELG